MTNKKNLVWYLCVSLVLIIVAVVLSLTVGINLGSDIGGGTQVEIKIENTQNVSQQTKQVKSALKEHGLIEERIFVEDKGVDTYLVVRVNKKNVDPKLRDTLIKKLGVEEEAVSTLQTISGTVTNRAVIWASVTIVCVLLAIFVAGWLRYKIMAGLTLLLAVLHSLIVTTALVIIVRLPINFISMAIILASVILTLFACVITLERLRENQKAKHNEGLSVDELVNMSQKSTLKPLIFIVCALLILALCLVCTPLSVVTMSGATIFVCLLVSAYTYYFVAMNIHKYLLEAKVTRDKIRLSRNPNIETTLKPEKAKAKAKSAEAKKKDKEMVKRQQAKRKKDDTSKPVV